MLHLTERLGAFPVPPWRSAAEIGSADHHLLLPALEAPPSDALLLVAELAGRVVGHGAILGLATLTEYLWCLHGGNPTRAELPYARATAVAVAALA